MMVNRKALFALLAASGVLCGCATPELNYRPQAQAQSFPPVGAVQEARIGEDMVRQGSSVTREAIYVPEKLSISLYYVAPGYFKKVGDTDKGEFFMPAGGTDSGQVIQRGMADAPQALMVRRSDRALCVVTVFNAYDCYSYEPGQPARLATSGFERRQLPEPAAAQRSVSYAGTAGNVIRVVYRDGAGTPTVIEHDLAAGPVLDAGGARIEVLATSGTSVSYRLLKPFPAP